MLQPLTPPQAPAARHGLRIGGLAPFTSIDFPGRLSAVLFVQGCPWRCGYCHNPHLQERSGQPEHSWSDTRAWLERRVGLIDGVVFSGGEPTVDPMLAPAMEEVRGLGFAIGLHTAGTHPRRLKAVLPLVDWVGLDIKAPLNDPEHYDRITGRPGSATGVVACLDALQRADTDFEVRTTLHPSWLDENALLRLATDLTQRGVRQWVLQVARPPPSAAWQTAHEHPSPATLARLRQTLPGVEVRYG